VESDAMGKYILRVVEKDSSNMVGFLATTKRISNSSDDAMTVETRQIARQVARRYEKHNPQYLFIPSKVD